MLTEAELQAASIKCSARLYIYMHDARIYIEHKTQAVAMYTVKLYKNTNKHQSLIDISQYKYGVYI